MIEVLDVDVATLEVVEPAADGAQPGFTRPRARAISHRISHESALRCEKSPHFPVF